jgi:uncharacterized hydantoinase/oxoprolinase family protein
MINENNVVLNEVVEKFLTMLEKEQRIKSLIESYKNINKDYVIIQIHDEVILCFVSKNEAIEYIKDEIAYANNHNNKDYLFHYLLVYYLINEGQKIIDVNYRTELKLSGNEEIICK